MGELDRVAQRQLQDADAELDPAGHRGERRQHLERVEGGSAAAQRIADPDAGKPPGFDLAAEIGDAIHQPAIRVLPILLCGAPIRIIVLTRMQPFLLNFPGGYARRHIGGRARTGSSSDQSPSSSTWPFG